MISIWDEQKKEYVWLLCGEKLYNAIIKASDELKEKFGTFQEPKIVLKRGESMDTSQEVMDIGDQIAALSPSKAGELLDYLKQTYNIEPAFGPPQFKEPDKKEKEPEQQVQTEFSVIITNYDPNNKVGLVKTYRELSGKGLKESMDAIVATASGTPLIVKEGLPKAEAEKLKAQLEAASAKVELK